MNPTNDPRRAARYAAWAFALAGPVTLLGAIANADRFAREGGNVAPIVGAGIFALFLALLIPVLPWRRWDPRATMVLPLLAIVVITVAEIGSKSSRTVDGAMSTGAIVTLIFVWIGLTQTRGWSLGIAPIVMLSLGVAFAYQDAPVSVATTMMSVLLAAIVGELVAWVKHADNNRSDELGLVIESTSRLREDADRSAAASRLVDTAVALLRVPNVAVYLETGDGRFVRAASVGDLVSQEHRVEGIVSGPSVRAVEAGTELMVPLVGRSGVARGLIVATGRRRQDEFMLRLAQILGEQAGVRLDDLAAIDALTDETRRDPLTGIGNRRCADQLIEELAPGDVIAVIDLDDLRGINERSGHQGGDCAIRAVAQYLSDAVRSGDAVARLGGDEFVIVLRDVGEAAFPLVERIAKDWNHANPDATFSVGAAVYDGGSPQLAVHAADGALFAAKRDGRARAHLADLGLPEVGDASGF